MQSIRSTPVILFALAAAQILAAQQVVPATPLATPQEAAAKAAASQPLAGPYDEKADAKEQIANALAKARRENQRVLIQWGGNWCGWCIKLNELFKRDAQIARKLMYEYVVVHVDAGKPAGKNVELAQSYGADLKKNGYPFLTILDADGKPLANHETATLEVDGQSMGHDPQKVMSLLTKFQADPQDAQKVLAAGLESARKSGQRIFVHFGAPWCGWCHRLEDWMAQADVRDLLARDFIDLKIDTDRMTGGKEVLDRYRGSKGGGIPWFAFLDADGKALVVSENASGQNIGFPAAPPEIAHFEKMLTATAKNLTAADIAKLIESLRNTDAAKKAAGGAH